MVEIYIMNSFCKDQKGGNKAGVVLDAKDLSVSQKMEIAKALNFSETAFVSDSEHADFNLQYYTPTEEVDLCGHATIAIFSLMNQLHMLEKNEYTIETKAGILRIKIEEDGLIFMEQNCPSYLGYISIDELSKCFEKEYISEQLPIQIVSTGLSDIILPIDTVEHLAELHPNLTEIAKLSKQKNVIGVHAFALERDSEITAVCRNFAPICGIDEESATGTSNCALACYLFTHYDQTKTEYIFEQGYNLNLASRILVHINTKDKQIESVFVGGYAMQDIKVKVSEQKQLNLFKQKYLIGKHLP